MKERGDDSADPLAQKEISTPANSPPLQMMI